MKLQNKATDRGENPTNYDRWFVIQAVDDDKPLSRVSPSAIIDKALMSKVRSWNCQINQIIYLFIIKSYTEYNTN